MTHQIITEEQLAELEKNLNASLEEAKQTGNRKEYRILKKRVEEETLNIFRTYGIDRIAIPWELTGTHPIAKFIFIRICPDKMEDWDLEYCEGDGYRPAKGDFFEYYASTETIRWILRTIELNKLNKIPVEKWGNGHKLIDRQAKPKQP